MACPQKQRIHCGGMTLFCSVFVLFGVPFGPDVLLVRVFGFQFSAGTSWPFKALCGHGQKRLVVHYRCFYSSFPNSCFFLLSSVFPLFINSLRKADCSQPWPGSLCKSHSTEPGGRPPAAPATAGGGHFSRLQWAQGWGSAGSAVGRQANVPAASPEMVWEKDGKALETRVAHARAPLCWLELSSALREWHLKGFCPTAGP